jgi:hypothetical protein
MESLTGMPTCYSRTYADSLVSLAWRPGVLALLISLPNSGIPPWYTRLFPLGTVLAQVRVSGLTFKPVQKCLNMVSRVLLGNALRLGLRVDGIL